MNQIPNIEETDNTREVEELKQFYSTEGIPEEMKQAISFMRQWLNEDRKATPMVTATDLWHWIGPDLYQQLQKVREEERERIVKTIRRKTLEWSSQYHLQNFDRTLSHQSGMAVGYSVATKALDHLLAGIQSGAPLDHSELDQDKV